VTGRWGAPLRYPALPRVRRRRGGYVLPFVLLVIAAASVVVLSTGTNAWRALRGATGAATSARLQLAAEAALAEAVEGWSGDSVATRPLGTAVHRSRVNADGLLTERRWERTAPDVVWLSVEARSGAVAGASPPHARLTRALSLTVPGFALGAALTSTGPIVHGAGSRVRAPALGPDSSGCAGEATSSVAEERTLPVAGLPLALGAGWSAWRQRAPAWPAAAADTLRPNWRAVQLRVADSVLTGAVVWQGLMLADGPLRIVGDLTLQGVLVVRGALDARGARLSVRGAVVVADPAGAPVLLGPSSTIDWNRCGVQMALATVALPRAHPFHAWHAVSP
jgi:hypothetical protein